MKVVVITSPRTASTFYCEQLSRQFDVPNYNEEFTQNSHHSKFLSESQVKTLNDEVVSRTTGIFKVHLHQVLHNDNFLNYPGRIKHVEFLCSDADEVHYLWRRDKIAQLKSGLIANFTNIFNDENYTNDIIDIKISKQTYDEGIKRIWEHLKCVKHWSERYPGIHVYTEDIIKENYKPYRQQYNFNVV